VSRAGGAPGPFRPREQELQHPIEPPTPRTLVVTGARHLAVAQVRLAGGAVLLPALGDQQGLGRAHLLPQRRRLALADVDPDPHVGAGAQRRDLAQHDAVAPPQCR